MHTVRIYAVSLILGGILLSCGSKVKTVPELRREPVPVDLLIEKTISGEMGSAVITEPFGLTKDLLGNIYFTDAGNNRLVKLDTSFSFVREYGGFGTLEGLLNYPTFITFDNNLHFLVTDEKNRRLSRYNNQLTFVEEIQFYDENNPLAFGSPSGIAFTRFGEVWAADREENRIVVFSNIGRFDRYVGDYGYAGGQLASPEKIVSLGQRGFIVCDAGNSRLMRYDSYGNFDRSIDNEAFIYPMAADYAFNQLWVLDGDNGNLYCMTLDGKVLYEKKGIIPGDVKGLTQPSDILFLDKNRLLVADSGNNRLIVIRIIYGSE